MPYKDRMPRRALNGTAMINNNHSWAGEERWIMTTSAPSRSLKWPTILNYAIAVVSAAISVVAAVALYPLWGAGATLFLCVVTFVALAASLQLQRKNQQMKIGELQEQNDRLRIETAELSEAATSARGAEQEMRQTVDMVPALIARYRADGYMDFRNKNWREYTGLSRDNLEGRRWGSALHPDEEEMVERLWREHIATGEPFELEQRLRQADGEYRWHRVRRVPLRGESGEVIKCMPSPSTSTTESEPKTRCGKVKL